MVKCESGTKLVQVLAMGKPLKFDDFDPSDTNHPILDLISQLGGLPLSVVQRALPIEDTIFPAESLIE